VTREGRLVDDMMVVTVGRDAIRIALMCALPMLMAGMVVGVLISVLQVATSIQDITITFIPKILAVFLALLFSMHWMLNLLKGFAVQILTTVGQIGT
jgi:flagellar biosynthetic protein FliQ